MLPEILLASEWLLRAKILQGKVAKVEGYEVCRLGYVMSY